MHQRTISWGDITGSFIGSLLLHFSVIGVLFVATIDSVESDSISPERSFSPAKLVEMAKNMPVQRQVVKKRRKRVITNISTAPLKATSTLKDWSAEVAVDELSKLEQLNELASLEGADQAFEEGRRAMNRRDFVANYRSVIRQSIERVWYQPPGTRLNTSATVEIRLDKNGAVLSVKLVRSSKNKTFDNSVLEAVRRTHRIPEIKDVYTQSKSVFENAFAVLRMRFIKT